MVVPGHKRERKRKEKKQEKLDIKRKTRKMKERFETCKIKKT
jgi:hypothetical protein